VDVQVFKPTRDLVANYLYIFSFMILPGFSSDGPDGHPDGHKASSSVIGVASGVLCEASLIIPHVIGLAY
jgi:hypothetical protein